MADLVRLADDKRARFGSSWRAGTIGRAQETPLPFDPRVTRVLDQVTATLRTARDLAQSIAPARVLTTDHPAAMAMWLTSRVGVLAMDPDGPAIFDDLEAAADKVVRLFDRPPDRVYVGRCCKECSESLYAEHGAASSVSCPRCQREHSIDERRQVLAEGVEDYLGTAKEISRLLRETLGEDVSQAMIWGYSRHGMLQERGVREEFTKDGARRKSALYRIGDVREAVTIMTNDKKTRRVVARLAKSG